MELKPVCGGCERKTYLRREDHGRPQTVAVESCHACTRTQEHVSFFSRSVVHLYMDHAQLSVVSIELRKCWNCEVEKLEEGLAYPEVGLDGVVHTEHHHHVGLRGQQQVRRRGGGDGRGQSAHGGGCGGQGRLGEGGGRAQARLLYAQAWWDCSGVQPTHGRPMSG